MDFVDLFSVPVPAQVAEVSQLEWIEDLPLLRVLNLLKNPLQVRKNQKSEPKHDGLHPFSPSFCP